MLEQKSASGCVLTTSLSAIPSVPAGGGGHPELKFVERVLLRHRREQVVDGDDPTYPRQGLD